MTVTSACGNWPTQSLGAFSRACMLLFIAWNKKTGEQFCSKAHIYRSFFLQKSQLFSLATGIPWVRLTLAEGTKREVGCGWIMLPPPPAFQGAKLVG